MQPRKGRNINDEKHEILYCLIDKEEFATSTNKSVYIAKRDSLVKQNGSYIIFIQNKTLALQDVENEDSPEYKKYEYFGDIEYFWIFNIFSYEMSSTLLVNKNDGECQELFGEPLISPNGDYICNASQVINYEPFQNLLQIWSIKCKQIKLIYQLEIKDNWIPDKIKWTDDNTIVFIQKRMGYTKHYSKIKINHIR
jgi:hypothetical protein